MARKTFALIAVLLLGSFALLFAPQVEFRSHAWTVMLACSSGLSAAFLYFLWRHRDATEPTHIEPNARRTHFIQAIAQGSIYFFVGHYWKGEAQWAPFVLYQLITAYVFDFLLSVYRTNRYKLGFQIFPIVLSINLFMWFKPEYFAGQVAMIFAAILAKAFVVRTVEGRPKQHVFNPSALPMAVMAVVFVIILNRENMMSTNNVVASYLIPPHFQLFVFSMGMLSHLASGVSFISLGTVGTLFAVDLLFRAFTGLPPTGDIVHPSVFIGITLLATDPVTSSRTRTGQLVYGCMYGVGILASYILLYQFGYPTYYDKILPVPIINFLSPYFDRLKVPLWGPMKSTLWARPWAPAALYAMFFLPLVPTIENNFFRRTYFIEHRTAFREPRPERRQRVDPEIGEGINGRIMQRCSVRPTLDACRLIPPRRF